MDVSGRRRVVRSRIVLLVVLALFATAVVGTVLVHGHRPAGRARLAYGSAGPFGAHGAAPRAVLGRPTLAPLAYRLAGPLPTLATSARVWDLGAGDSPVRSLALALGLHAPVQEAGDGWIVRSGTSVLGVARAGAQAWHYAAVDPCPPEAVPAAGTKGSVPAVGAKGSEANGSEANGLEITVGHGCATAGRAVIGCSSDEPCGASRGAPAPTCDHVPACSATPSCPGVVDGRQGPVCAPPRGPSVAAPGAEEAEAVARRVVGAGGFSLTSARITTVALGDVRQVRVQPTLDGLAVLGLDATVDVEPSGTVREASGWLGRATAGAPYPLVPAATALERLRNGRLAGGGPLVAMGRPGSAATGEDRSVGAVGGGGGPAAGPAAGVGGPAAGVGEARCGAIQAPVAPATPGAPTARPQRSCPPLVRVCGSDPTEGVCAEPVPAPEPVTITGAHVALLVVGVRLQPVIVFELDGGASAPPVPAVVDALLADPQPRP